MIYLMRHGLDDESFIGGYSNVGLVEEGKKQVNDAGMWLKDNVIGIKRIYSSDVKRAIETTEIINNYLNLDSFVTKDLRELDKGLLNGVDKNVAKVKFPDYIGVDDINIRYPSGESMVDLYERIKLLFEDISKYDNCLLITHRGVINMLYVLLNGDELTMDKEKYNVTHASIHELDLVNKKIRRIK